MYQNEKNLDPDDLKQEEAKEGRFCISSLSLSTLFGLQILRCRYYYFLKTFSFHSPPNIVHWNNINMLFINPKGLVELSNQMLDLSVDGDEICLSLYLLQGFLYHRKHITLLKSFFPVPEPSFSLYLFLLAFFVLPMREIPSTSSCCIEWDCDLSSSRTRSSQSLVRDDIVSQAWMP